MRSHDKRTDAELLAAARRDPEAFAAFYRRHERMVLAVLLRRTRDPELAADLCAEAFAAALVQADRAPRQPLAWLLGIAHHKLVDSVRRGVVEDRARRALAMGPVALTDADLERIEREAGGDAALEAAFAALPAEQREAVRARIVDERDYPEIAARLRCSEQVVRKRVSRGLAALRARLSEGTA